MLLYNGLMVELNGRNKSQIHVGVLGRIRDILVFFWHN